MAADVEVLTPVREAELDEADAHWFDQSPDVVGRRRISIDVPDDERLVFEQHRITTSFNVVGKSPVMLFRR